MTIHRGTILGSCQLGLHGYGYPIYVNIPYEWTKNPDPPKVLTITTPWVPTVYLYCTRYLKDKQCVYLPCDVSRLLYLGKRRKKLDTMREANFRLNSNYKVPQARKKSGGAAGIPMVDGSYLECQVFWRISGIERDVYLTPFLLFMFQTFLPYSLDK